jgi:hypothetical protein
MPANWLTFLLTIAPTIIGIATLISQWRLHQKQLNANIDIAELRNRLDAEFERLRQLNPEYLVTINKIKEWAKRGAEITKSVYEMGGQVDIDNSYPTKIEVLTEQIDQWSDALTWDLPMVSWLTPEKKISDANQMVSLEELLKEYRCVVTLTVNYLLDNALAISTSQELSERPDYVKSYYDGYSMEDYNYGRVLTLYEKIVHTVEYIKKHLVSVKADV